MDIKLVENLLKEKVSELGFELYSLSYKRQKGNAVLEVVIDRVEPIDMDTILNVSREISSYLDEKDLIEDAYMLDVSSLGAEKPLKVSELHKYVGQYVNLHLNNPYKGENIIEGTLSSVDADKLVLTYRIKTRQYAAEIALDNILKARLAIKF